MISSIRNITTFQGSFKKDYIDYTKYAHAPSIKVIPVLKDENIKSLIDSKSITMADIFLIVNDIATICEDYSIKEILESLKNPNTYKFISKYRLRLAQAPLVVNLSDKQIKAFEDSLKKLNNPELEETTLFKIQNEDGYSISAETKEEFDKEFETYIHFKITTTPNGDSQISRNETDLIYNSTSRLQKDGTTTLKKVDYYEEDKKYEGTYTTKLIEIKPDCILCTRLSDKLAGIYEITRYDFQDYPQDYDLLSAVKNNNSLKGIPVSKIEEDGNSVCYTEDFKNGDIVSKRYYKESKDGSKRFYQYNIFQNENSLLDIKRGWEKLSDNITITTLNNKTYKTDFSNPQKVKITDDKGNTTVINILQKMRGFSLDFIKQLDALTLLNINQHTKQTRFVKSNTEPIYQRLSEIIYSTEQCFALNHELGHAIECDKYYSDEDYPKLHDELLKIYQEEFQKFKNSSNSDIQESMEYFSNISASCGIDEFIAETNAILNTPINQDPVIAHRGQMLVRYFPKTIASAAKLLGYGC